MKAIKIEINPAWNGNVYNVSICIDAWIKLRTGVNVPSFLKKDRTGRDVYAIYIQYGTEKDRRKILELLDWEKSPELIAQIKEIDVYGLNNRIHPDNIKGADSMSIRYYNVVYSYLMTEIERYESQKPYVLNWSEHRKTDELTNVMSNMRFLKIPVS